MTDSYPEDSGNTESTAEQDGSDSLQEELEGELVPSPPATATEDPDTTSVTEQSEDSHSPA